MPPPPPAESPPPTWSRYVPAHPTRGRRRTPRAAVGRRGAWRLGDRRVAEVGQLDLVIDDGAVRAYRAKVKVSFKYEGES